MTKKEWVQVIAEAVVAAFMFVCFYFAAWVLLGV